MRFDLPRTMPKDGRRFIVILKENKGAVRKNGYVRPAKFNGRCWHLTDTTGDYFREDSVVAWIDYFR